MDLSKLPSVTFNDVLNDTQFCYHLVYPKFFNLAKKQNRTQTSSTTNKQPGAIGKNEKKRRRRGRPRKEEVAATKRSEEARRAPIENTTTDDKSDANIVQCSRTRSGRVSRPPKHMSKFMETRISNVSEVNLIPMDTSEPQSSQQNTEQMPVVAEPLKMAPEPKRVRKNMDRFTCKTCKKVYLGRKKLLKHYLAFPEHKAPANRPLISSQFQANGIGIINGGNSEGGGGTNSFLFDEMMKLISQTAQTERISIFLAEVSNFVSKVDALKSKIIHSNTVSHQHHKSTSEYTSTSEYYLDKNVSKVLDMPEGLHQLNDRAFDDNFHTAFSTYIDDRPVPSMDISSLSNLQLQSLDYNLDHFPLVNYDQISDNAVEAEALGKSNGTDNSISDLHHENPILDISLDLFSFNGIK